MGKSIVSGRCFVRNAAVAGTVDISECARIDGIDISIYGDATVNGHAKIGGYANIFDRAWIYGNAVISGIANIGGSARVHDHVQIDGDVHIIDPVDMVGNAIIRCIDDFVIMHNNWSSGRAFIWTRSNNKWSVGCFYGTGNALIKRAYKESEYKGKCYEAAVRYVEQLSKYREENEPRYVLWTILWSLIMQWMLSSEGRPINCGKCHGSVIATMHCSWRSIRFFTIILATKKIVTRN